MGQVKPQYIANSLLEFGSNAEFKNLSEVIFDFFKSHGFSMSDEEISDYVEENLLAIANELFIKVDDRKNDGVTLNFELIEDQGTFYIKFFERVEIELLRTLQSDTPENFEQFCKKVLDKLGGNTIVSGGSDDGGIDFSSSDLQIKNLPSLSTKGSRILVLGQAKRYTDGHHVKETELRAFVGASIKRIDELKKTRSEQFGIMHPIILAFWTTSDFHSNARDYAKNIGIWYLNGAALCQLAIKLGMMG